MKKFLLLSLLVFVLPACEKPAVHTAKIKLTKEETDKFKGNSNGMADFLVKKAVLEEMKNYKYSEEEEKELQEIFKNIEMEFFLNKIGLKNAKVDDMEVLQVYQNNIEKLQKEDIVKVLPEIKQKMLIQRAETEKIKYMNSLVDKYNLNDELKKHFPELKEIKKAKETKKEETALDKDNQQSKDKKQLEKKTEFKNRNTAEKK